MRKYQQLSKEIIQGLGGMDNVNSAVHCATRLRFDLKDPAAAKLDQLKEIDGVVGVNPTPTQLQVIIGSHVGEVFEEVIHQGVTNGDAEVKKSSSDGTSATSNRPAKETSIFNKVVDTITGCMTPMIPADANDSSLDRCRDDQSDFIAVDHLQLDVDQLKYLSRIGFYRRWRVLFYADLVSCFCGE
ncbi:PTS transporter subunit EIIB [Enterococcus malodoratus]|uniref:PTS transporter subunit EIIB n=1 Tax=Enterococcus malodoratus TaxID=71451 RepID=UPI0039B06DF7